MSNHKKTDHHAAGQRHGQTGKGKPPHSVLTDFFTWSREGQKKVRSENGAYWAGYRNATKQR